MSKTARLVREEWWVLTKARIYELSEPIEFSCWVGPRPWPPPSAVHPESVGKEETFSTRYVAVSATALAFDHGGPEVMAFACDESGELLPDGRHTEVGCLRGTTDHDAVLKDMGFIVITAEAVH